MTDTIDRYRKLPVEIEARQLTDDADWPTIAAWCGATPREHERGDLKDQLAIPTLEGVIWASVGDWIIRGVQGEFYPCKPDIFAATYEPAAAPVVPPADRAAERDRIAETLYAHDHPGWRVPLRESDVEPAYRERAAAVLGVLPEPADQAAYRLAADAIEAMPSYPRLVLPEEIVAWLRRMGGEAQPAVEPSLTPATGPTFRRETVEYFLQARQPDGSWEDSSSFMDDLSWAEQRLAARRQKYPDFVHRLAQRTTTVVVQPLADCPSCEAGIEHTVHCPTPETHNWGCGCPTDEAPAHDAELRRVADEAQPEFTESVIYQVVGDWGVDSADSAEGARAAVAKWLRAYPKCGAFAQQRVCRDWPDGSEFYGPWTDLPDEQPAVVSEPGKEANPRSVCVCGHTRAEHIAVSGRLLCDACDPDSTENLVCKEFDAL